MSDLSTPKRAPLGSWHQHFVHTTNPREAVLQHLGDRADTVDVDGLVDAYVAAINAALPDGWELNGDRFSRPYRGNAGERRSIKEIVGTVELDSLIPGAP